MTQVERYNEIAKKLGLAHKAHKESNKDDDLLIMLDYIVERLLQAEDDITK